MAMRKQKVTGVIPARYESKRLPGKPLVLVNGKPLIQRVFERAKKSKSLDELMVVTDDQRIFDLVKNFGGKVKLSSKSHPTGTDRVAEAVYDLDSDIVVNIQCDEPFLNPKMIDDLVLPLKRDKEINMTTLAKRMNNNQNIENPNLVKVILDREDFAIYFSRFPIPYSNDNYARHYEHIGIYAFRKSFLMKLTSLPQTPLEKSERLEQLRVLEHGYKIKVVLTRHRAFSINTLEDLKQIDRMLKSRGGKS